MVKKKVSCLKKTKTEGTSTEENARSSFKLSATFLEWLMREILQSVSATLKHVYAKTQNAGECNKKGQGLERHNFLPKTYFN